MKPAPLLIACVCLSFSCLRPAAGNQDESGTTGPTPLECERYLDEDSCVAAGCAGMFAVREVADAGTCETALWDQVCLAQGDESSLGRTYYRIVDGAPTYYSTSECVADLEFGGTLDPGEGWTECTGASGEPEGCACFCVAGSCPGEAEFAEQKACEVDMLCPQFELNGESSPMSGNPQCFFGALKARTPGYLYAFGDFGDPNYANHLWIMQDGQVRWSQGVGQHGCVNCCLEFAPALDLCTLASDAELDACMQAFLDPEGAPHPCTDDFSVWFESCEATTPLCE